MNKQTRRKFSPDFEAKVALEAIKNQFTLAELSKKFDVSPVVISKWKGEFLENMASVFEKDNVKKQDEGPDLDQLYSQIGQLKVENDFLKKSCRKLGI
ncbi:transposase [Rhodonellum sp.]|uniref:transposase n=1 Tax=Rhodonellum sp. TaxID=2231180 RepID=UPI00271DEB6D|nr:transposase [Rhodonellum sp.]MDO9553368.1 transposase [Rhodonellum sp.]